jgi:hypothetical protein
VNIAIVGGGFSGAMTALALAGAGHEVTVYEAEPELGGIVRDVHTPHGRFFRGCHYMNLAPTLKELWPRIEGLELSCFDHHYGSWNDLFGPVMVHHGFAQPVVPGAMGDGAGLKDFGNLWKGSVADYLTVHEPRVAEPLTSWASRVGPVNRLAACNVIPLQVGRVFYPEDVRSVRSRKQADPQMDATLGLPRELFEPPVKPQGGVLPSNGFDGYMRSLEVALVKHGVNLVTDAPVKPHRLQGGRCGLSLRGTALEAEWVIWCANPSPLLKVMMGQRLESHVTKCVYLYACVEGTLPADPIYYQIFGRDNPLMRIFSYDLEGRRLTVEALDEGWHLPALVEVTQQVMQDLGWRARITEAVTKAEKRYSLVSKHDLACIESFAGQAANMRLITGGWQHYGRDQRLDDILRQLAEVGLT